MLNHNWDVVIEESIGINLTFVFSSNTFALAAKPPPKKITHSGLEL